MVASIGNLALGGLPLKVASAIGIIHSGVWALVGGRQIVEEILRPDSASSLPVAAFRTADSNARSRG